MFRRFLRFSFLIVFAITAATSNADLVINGDFETGAVDPWVQSGSLFVSSDAVYRSAGGTGSFPTGNSVINFGGGNTANNGTLSQEIVTSPGAHMLTFDYGQFLSATTQRVRVTATDVASSAVLLDQTVSDPTGTANLAAIMDPYAFQFNATGAATRIAFADVSDGTIGSDGTLDNIQVVTVVPETSTLSAMMLIACAVGWHRRRKSKSNGLGTDKGNSEQKLPADTVV